SKNAPLADVFYGVDNTFLSRALDEAMFETYASPLLASIPAEFKLDVKNQALPVDYGDVCINYDKTYFSEKNLALPQSLEELTDLAYKGLLVVENPATSSPGLAFLLATVAHYGEDGYLDYWQQLKDNGLVVVNDWETAYYTNFSGSSGHGPQPMVVSYASSPPAEVIFAETPLTEAPTASITAPGTCFRQIEFVGILAGTPQHALAEKFVDFMLSVPFQEDMPLQMFVYPVQPEAKLPEAFVKYAQVPQQPAALAPEDISANRNAWIEAWTETVLR
ncbi:MAG: ABC transporter substrate-binding protein, partial [Chloroflexi bacterium GWB2_54_36]